MSSAAQQEQQRFIKTQPVPVGAAPTSWEYAGLLWL